MVISAHVPALSQPNRSSSLRVGPSASNPAAPPAPSPVVEAT